jgi:Rod binding domain-containing protein
MAILGAIEGAIDMRGVGEAAPNARSLAAKDAAERFEALFISILLAQAFGEESGSGLFGNGGGAHIYEGLFETYLAEHISRRGGLGLARAIERTFEGKRGAL